MFTWGWGNTLHWRSQQLFCPCSWNNMKQSHSDFSLGTKHEYIIIIYDNFFGNGWWLVENELFYIEPVLWNWGQCPEQIPFLQRVCHKIFDLYFFHDSNPSGPLINRLKYFRIWFRFPHDIHYYSITKFEIFDLAVCTTPRSQNFKLSKSKIFHYYYILLTAARNCYSLQFSIMGKERDRLTVQYRHR